MGLSGAQCQNSPPADVPAGVPGVASDPYNCTAESSSSVLRFPVPSLPCTGESQGSSFLVLKYSLALSNYSVITAKW